MLFLGGSVQHRVRERDNFEGPKIGYAAKRIFETFFGCKAVEMFCFAAFLAYKVFRIALRWLDAFCSVSGVFCLFEIILETWKAFARASAQDSVNASV